MEKTLTWRFFITMGGKKITPLGIKTLAKCRISMIWLYDRKNKAKYNCNKKKDTCICSRYIIS
jgi:hypothetical protein